MVKGSLIQKITKNAVEALGDGRARRFSFAYEPHNKQPERRETSYDQVGVFRVPFCDTVESLFSEEARLNLNKGNDNPPNCYRYIEDDDEFGRIQKWVRAQGTRVFIRDCLDLSIALDFNHPGNVKDYTRFGKAEHDAKHELHARSVTRLTAGFVEAIRSLPFYRDAGLICAVPAHPSKSYDLPRTLAAKIFEQLELEDITSQFAFKRRKKSAKDAEVGQKWDVWENCGLSFDKPLGDQPVILIDDKYQSGVSIQYVASKLYDAGASEVYGLCAVKTLRNTDNT